MHCGFLQRTRFLGKNVSGVSFKSTVTSQKVSQGTMTSEEVIQSCKDHTFWTWSAQAHVKPIHMKRAKGIYFWDADGKRYMDMNSQLMCTNVGHQHPKIIQAIKDQAESLAFAGPMFATDIRAELGPMIAKRTPKSLQKVFFTLGGSEANENAIKLARQHTGRNKIIARYRSYHGATHGANMLTGDPRRWPNEDSGMGGVVRVFDPIMYRSLMWHPGMSEEEFSAVMVAQLEETILFENPNNIAAMMLETVTGTNGVIPPPEGYLRGVRALLKKYGIMMICDEVMCGLGRTGEWFAVDHWGVEPDMITMAKGLTSGYLPLGAVAMSSEIAASFDDRPFAGGLTYSGHPMCLATAVAALKVMEEENLVANSKAMGKHMSGLLQGLKKRHRSVGDVRCIGLFAAIEVVTCKRSREPLVPYNGSDPTMAKMQAFLREKGIFIFCHQNMMHVIPPLIITPQQLDEAFSVIDQALEITDEAAAEY